MSELIITPKCLNEFDYYQQANSYLIGNSSFCVRYNYSFSLEEIKLAKLKSLELKKNLYINVNKIFQEKEMDNLKNYLVFLKEIDVDGIFFSDYAVLQLAIELEISHKCVFYHETYPLNTLDIEVLKNFNLKGIIISKEVEITTLKKASKFSNIGMIAFGHLEIFNSKRKLLENYINKFNVNKSLVNSYNISIKEMTRNNLYPLFQDENGTNIFTEFVYSALRDFKELNDLRIQYFIIDTIFLDSDYCLSVLNIFDKIRNGEEVDLDLFYQESKYPLGSGFLHLEVGLIK